MKTEHAYRKQKASLFLIVLASMGLLYADSTAEETSDDNQIALESSSDTKKVATSIDKSKSAIALEEVQEFCNVTGGGDTLALNAEPVINFLHKAQREGLPLTAIDGGLRIFYNRFKGCLFIDDNVVHDLIPALLQLVVPQVNADHERLFSITTIHKEIEQLLSSCFIKYSDMFSKKPNEFISKVAGVVSNVSFEILAGDESRLAVYREERQRLRLLVFQFLDLLLDRVSWAPYAYETIWESFVKMGSDICLFAERDIITHMDDLRGLYWSLVHRTIFYLDLHAHLLPPSFFEVVLRELDDHSVFFLEEDETADIKKFLRHGIEAARIKSLAAERVGLYA
jgi:hypothetical protein